MLADTHCHLDQFTDPKRVIEKAIQRGVSKIVAVSEDIHSMKKVLELKRNFPENVLAGLAIHPANIPEMSEHEIEESLEFISQNLQEIDLIGETGLDYKYAQEEKTKEKQKEVLYRHFQLAKQARIPVNLHSRRAQRQTMEQAIQFSQETHLNAQLHWFTASRKLVRQCNEKGIYISVGPSILSQPETEKVIKEIRLDRILLESDGPVKFNGIPASPFQVVQVAEKIALWKKIPLEDLISQLALNFESYLSDQN